MPKIARVGWASLRSGGKQRKCLRCKKSFKSIGDYICTDCHYQISSLSKMDCYRPSVKR